MRVKPSAALVGTIVSTTTEATTQAMNKITVYSTRYCAWCVRAKALLNQNGLAYEEIVLDDANIDARAELERLTGGHTFPQIVIDGVTVGGYSELVPFVRAAA
jgi:glutaredoxin 3